MATISTKLQDALNKQINNELYSSYLYLSMSAWASSENLKGSAVWLATQAREENAHGMKIYQYILDRGGKVALTEIKTPAGVWGSLGEVFTSVYEHELNVTKLIHALSALAVEEKDLATQVFLQWFVTEQVEEEANALTVLDTLKQIGDSKGSLYMLDRQLGKRTGG